MQIIAKFVKVKRDKEISIAEALELFVLNANSHALAIENGDYKTANKAYDKIVQAANFLKSRNQILLLSDLLDHTSVGVRSWAACYLLPVAEVKAKSVLEEISKREDIHGFNAEMDLVQWEKGELKL